VQFRKCVQKGRMKLLEPVESADRVAARARKPVVDAVLGQTLSNHPCKSVSYCSGIRTSAKIICAARLYHGFRGFRVCICIR
jgi:hypothetical protein